MSERTKRVRSDANPIVWAFECYSLSATVGTVTIDVLYIFTLFTQITLVLELAKCIEQRKKVAIRGAEILFRFPWCANNINNSALVLTPRNGSKFHKRHQNFSSLCGTAQPVSWFSISMVWWCFVGTIKLPHFTFWSLNAYLVQAFWQVLHSVLLNSILL